MASSPIQLSHQACGEYLQYLLFAFRLSAPELAEYEQNRWPRRA